MKDFLTKYKHAWVFLYFIIYLIWFYMLEQHITVDYVSIHIGLDNYIPFNEWFVIPYILWFLYIAATVVYFFIHSKTEFYHYIAFLFIGMTICLIIYTFFPNGQDLRPDLSKIDGNNYLLGMISRIYSLDTPTNVCPSIHVYNSIGAHIAVHKNEKLRKYPILQFTSLVLAVSIGLSTMFIKQHSAFDAICSIALSVVMYLLVYYPKTRLSHKTREKEIFAN